MFSNFFKTFLLLTLMAGLFLFVGYIIGGEIGLVFAFVVSLLFNFFSYFFSHKIVLMSYGAKPLSESEAPRLHAILAELSQSAGIPKPPLYIVENDSPNAFATGRNPKNAVVCVTSGLVGLLNEEEIKGVLGHELAHIYNRDIFLATIVASFASAIMMLANMARWVAFFGGSRDRNRGGNPIGLIALLITAILAPLAAILIQAAISRQREYLADATGAKFAGNPMGLANALRKLFAASRRIPLEASPATSHMFIVKPFTGETLLNLFSTHPPIEKRIERLTENRG
ncbi:MAG: zinc metalloprotease HtpX [Thermoanaerobaculaceae bacterium]|nr:zinc metalloprotease HtpX [Thermoanaerobaculaceae bacterium]